MGQEAEKESKREAKEALKTSMKQAETEKSHALVQEVGATEAASGAATQSEVTSSITQAVEYTLGESEVMPLQESVLYSMLNALAERHLATYRVLEITGFSEIREEADVARQRAEKVREWLIDHGAAEENIVIVPPRSDEKRGSRRTEMKLVDSSAR